MGEWESGLWENWECHFSDGDLQNGGKWRIIWGEKMSEMWLGVIGLGV
jgi:hypothetical protein